MGDFMYNLFRGVIGLAGIYAFLYFYSKDRKNINWRLVGGGFALQIVIAVLVIKVPGISNVIKGVSTFFVELLGFSVKGSEFIFGKLSVDKSYEATFAFKILPSIVFFSALSSLLYYLGILQRVVYVFAWVMHKTMRLSGAESLACAANVFIGQTEAPLVIRPYLERMTRSEIVCLMTGGFATIAGAVLVAYMEILGGNDEALKIEVGKHLISASIMAAPSAIICAKMLFPEREQVDTELKVSKESIGINVFDAITGGTTQGVRLAVNVGAIVLVFLALMEMLDFITLKALGSWTGLNDLIMSKTDNVFEGLTLRFIFGILFAPVACLVGVDTDSLLVVGQLFGEKLAINEFVAYVHMNELIVAGHLTNPKAILISTYALCGFASFTSMGIQIGGISVLAPGQRSNLANLAFRAVVGGTCATLMTASIAGAIS